MSNNFSGSISVKDGRATIAGAIIAATSGMAMIGGYCLLFEPHEKLEIMLRRMTGGGMLFLGIYTWSPPFIRVIWNKL